MAEGVKSDRDESNSCDAIYLVPVGERTPHNTELTIPDDCQLQVMKTEPLPKCCRPVPLPDLPWVDPEELWAFMSNKEDYFDTFRDCHYFRNNPLLSPRMRSILLDWLIEVSEVYKLRRATYYLALDFIDRFISAIDGVQKSQLQLIGITCLYITSKIEEIYGPKLSEFSYVTDGACTEEEILKMEVAIFKVLKWNINSHTPLDWFKLYMQLVYKNKKHDQPVKVLNSFLYPQYSVFEFLRGAQLLDLCCLDNVMLRFRYSVIAASVINFIFDTEVALFVSGFAWHDLKSCVEWMAPYYDVLSQHSSLFFVQKELSDSISSGLKKRINGIVCDEAHTIQVHYNNLEMLSKAQRLKSMLGKRKLDDTDWSSDTPEKDDCL